MGFPGKVPPSNRVALVFLTLFRQLCVLVLLNLEPAITRGEEEDKLYNSQLYNAS